jgi:hypothetical protein
MPATLDACRRSKEPLAEKSPARESRVLAGKPNSVEAAQPGVNPDGRAEDCRQAVQASQGAELMQATNAINCNGLSAAPILLRIKQALVGRVNDTSQLEILVDADCDRDRLRPSLGRYRDAVRLVSHPQ